MTTLELVSFVPRTSSPGGVVSRAPPLVVTEARLTNTRTSIGRLLLLLPASGFLLLLIRMFEPTVSLRDHPPTIAFCGNSMQYYNDSPRLVELLLTELYETESKLQDSCLRGGSNLESLWRDGNGVQTQFFQQRDPETKSVPDIGAPSVAYLLHHPPEHANYWNFVLIQDDVLFVVQEEMRQESIASLLNHYLPAMMTLHPKPTILLLQTFPPKRARYRERSAHMGDYTQFTEAIVQGYQEYANVIRSQGFACRLVPMARAVQSLMDTDMWADHIYHSDMVHPSPHATWLQACLVVALLTQRAPPRWDDHIATEWQRRARFWQQPSGGGGGDDHHPEDNTMLPLPTVREAEVLRQLACRLVLWDFRAPPETHSDAACTPP